MLSTALELLGFLLIVAAAYLVALPLALLVAGLGLVVIANLVLPEAKPKAGDAP